MTRSTASRRARNSDSVMTGGLRRPESRPSLRRWRLASSRVDPRTTCTSSPESSAERPGRTCTTVFGGSSGPVWSASAADPRRRLRRRRRLPPEASSSPGSTGASASSERAGAGSPVTAAATAAARAVGLPLAGLRLVIGGALVLGRPGLCGLRGWCGRRGRCGLRGRGRRGGRRLEDRLRRLERGGRYPGHLGRRWWLPGRRRGRVGESFGRSGERRGERRHRGGHGLRLAGGGRRFRRGRSSAAPAVLRHCGGPGGTAASTPGRPAGGGALFCLVSAGCRGRGSRLGRGGGRGGGRVGGGRGRCAGLRIGRRRRPGSRLSSPPAGGAGAWRRLTGGCVAYAGRAFAAWPVTAGLCVV